MTPFVNLVVVSIAMAVVIADYNDDLKKISDTIQTVNSQLRDLTQQLVTSQSQNDKRRNFTNELEKKKDEDSSFSNKQMNDFLNAFKKDADSQFNDGVPVMLKYVNIIKLKISVSKKSEESFRSEQKNFIFVRYKFCY